jgi:3-(3-hydroxy-phenyl)propionate hydroxylase
MRERDPERRRQMLDDLIVTTEDRTRLKAYLMKSSMIDGLRQAAASVRTG